MSKQVLLEGKQLSKAFGRFVALENADFKIHAGEVHGLCGSNGAGQIDAHQNSYRRTSSYQG